VLDALKILKRIIHVELLSDCLDFRVSHNLLIFLLVVYIKDSGSIFSVTLDVPGIT